MKIAPYVEKLNGSAQYKQFSKEYKDAFMIAGFFVLDFEGGRNIHQIDFYVPSKHKIAAFTLDEGVTVQLLQALNQKVPAKLDIKTRTDLEALKGILEDEMKNRSITEDIKKVIAVIQNLDGKKIWSLNCVLSGMGILHANVDDDSQTVLKMEKTSLLDYIKKIPGAQLSQLGSGSAAGTEGDGNQVPNSNPAKGNSASAAEQIQKLNKLEEAIEKEKAQLKQQMEKVDKKDDSRNVPAEKTKVSKKK